MSDRPISPFSTDDGYGYIVTLDSPMRYHVETPLDTEVVNTYILICDKGKYFSLINPYYQTSSNATTAPTDGAVEPVNKYYVKTNFKSGAYNIPATYVQPADSTDVGYILQSILSASRITSWIGRCDFTYLNNSTYAQTPLADRVFPVVVAPARYSLFGKFGTYYPGDALAFSSFKAYTAGGLYTDMLNNDMYSTSNQFYTIPDPDAPSDTTPVHILPALATYINKAVLIKSKDPYSVASEVRIVPVSAANLTPINTCTATNYDVYAGDEDYKYSPLEKDRFDANYSFSICYPVSLSGECFDFVEKLVENQGIFLDTRKELVRPMFKSFHINSYDYTWEVFVDIVWVPFLPFGGIVTGYNTAVSTFTYTWYAIPTDKRVMLSSGMYANTDVMFSDAFYSTAFAAAAGFRYQVLRSTRGTLIVKYKPVTTSARHHIAGWDQPRPQETDDLFYFMNSLNPEEHMFCDGVLFGKQQFLYSQYSMTSMLGVTLGVSVGASGGWAPEVLAGSQNIMLKGISITVDRGLLSTSYEAVPDPNPNPNSDSAPDKVWKFTDIEINSISHVVGAINSQVYQETSNIDQALGFRDYVSSAQAPYDHVFCEGVEGETVKIPDYILYGITSTQGFLDDIYDRIISEVRQSFVNKTCYAGVQPLSFTGELFSILLVSNDPRLMYNAAVSYEYCMLNPTIIGGFRVTHLQGKNPATYDTVGRAFLYGGNGFKHILVRQSLTVECNYEFNVDMTADDGGSIFFYPFPFGSCTSTIASARVVVNGVKNLVPLIIRHLVITGGTPEILCDLSLNDGEGLTYPKTYTFNNNVFTHSAKDIIMLNRDGTELLRSQLACVLNNPDTQHTCIDRFDTLISAGMGTYMINEYNRLHP